MTRTGGDKTKRRILDVAERLFAAHGFDGTSVDAIARAAGVNKALIYYHFKNKADLILTLLRSIIDDVESAPGHDAAAGAAHSSVNEAVRAELDFLADRKEILSVMLAEALGSRRHERFLFRLAELVVEGEHGHEIAANPGEMVHEFFSGVLPLIAFVALRDKWCKHFGCDPEQATRHFVESFARSHLRSHDDEGGPR